MSTVLLVHHSPSDATAALAEAARAGLTMPELEGVELVEKAALEATVEDVLAADAFVLGTTANFGYISGALKHFFDTTYSATREQTAGRPFSYWIHGGYDTTGAERAMESITTGYGWEKVCAPVVFTGEVTEEHTAAVTEMAATVAATTMA
ncbi:flavodoxin family protein [Brevibacterium sp. CS2]|uniref:flavodoxin family protein n=1 Tax=Brevibacterium sp. CS2 TaxID=2575923 RepID=UPI0010C7D328|nr:MULTISPECIES: NAD(P)H-dependent oxidoreductase [Actinomycetes]MCX0277792.1 NAD(P)H-dependent oxidoreductase [Nocardia zapadnayensis]QCP04128.1 flavodoxin [Brevibacterium sp. CS2]